MKIRCDHCNRMEASIFCSADEACLCSDCDLKIHQVNKLASKHPRFNLIQPTNFPICDICQDKKALLFCHQDKAILCTDCDVSIHTVNEHTKKHNRFLLTGVTLSSASYLSPTPTVLTTTAAAAAAGATAVTSRPSNSCSGSVNNNAVFFPVPDYNPQNSTTKKAPLPSPIPTTPIPSTNICFSQNPNKEQNGPNCIPASTTSPNVGSSMIVDDGGGCEDGGGGTTSSISEYLMDMLPAWQVEDILDPFSAPFGFAKGSTDDDLFLEADLTTTNNKSYISSVNTSSWAPQQVPAATLPPPPQPQPLSFISDTNTNTNTIGMNNYGQFYHQGAIISGEMIMDKESNITNMTTSEGFTVPQLTFQYLVYQRPRPSYY